MSGVGNMSQERKMGEYLQCIKQSVYCLYICDVLSCVCIKVTGACTVVTFTVWYKIWPPKLSAFFSISFDCKWGRSWEGGGQHPGKRYYI